MSSIPIVPQDKTSSATTFAISGATLSQLEDLTAQATAKYALKDYNAAVDLYSRAMELQADINGEMSPLNADLLYYYGRCLYHVAVGNSDVLGDKVAADKREQSEKKLIDKATSKRGATADEYDTKERTAEVIVSVTLEEKDGAIENLDTTQSVPFFKFTGDENFDDSDKEEDDAGAEELEGEDAADEDDFSNAFEVLDLARILLQRKLEDQEVHGGRREGALEPDAARQLKERLADTYDLQAEISLEGERFLNAVVDLKAALKLKGELFPIDSSLIAEAHYKLSLALEFSSVMQQKNENNEIDAGHQVHIDKEMREEAAREMEAAITSCKRRIEREEATLVSRTAGLGDSDKSKVTKESIDDVKEIVRDMEQRLVELRQPPVSINDSTGAGSTDGANPMNGILGHILGESPEALKARLEEASKGANDLTNLVKRKKLSNAEEESKDQIMPANGRKRHANDEDYVVSSRSEKNAKLEHAE